MKRHNVTAGFQSDKAHISVSTITKPFLALKKGKTQKKVKWNARNNNQSRSSENLIQKLDNANCLASDWCSLSNDRVLISYSNYGQCWETVKLENNSCFIIFRIIVANPVFHADSLYLPLPPNVQKRSPNYTSQMYSVTCHLFSGSCFVTVIQFIGTQVELREPRSENIGEIYNLGYIFAH